MQTLRWILRLAFLLASTLSYGAAAAQTPWYEGFEGPDTSWRLAGGDAQYRIDSHRRLAGDAHSGSASEHWRITGNGGTSVYIGHQVGLPRVIDELTPTLWVKSDRTGLQILARVVLPRSVDPTTRAPRTVLIHGNSYSQAGRWQQLRIQEVPKGVAGAARMLRLEAGPEVDVREAYIDEILLNIYGGPGVTNVWIDDLDIAGYVSAGPVHAGLNEPVGRSSSAAVQDSSEVRMVGSMLTVDEHAVFPRIVQHQGEPLSLIRSLGFNGIWLPSPPGADLLNEARRLGLWIVCPPPVERGAAGEDQVQPMQEFDRVLAWDLGRVQSLEQVARLRDLAAQVREIDQSSQRPLLCAPDAGTRACSRFADALVFGRDPLCGGLGLTEYGNWLRERPRLARPGTPFWTSVQTEVPRALMEQWTASGAAWSEPPALDGEQIRLLTYTGIAAGSRGLLFQSSMRLDSTDAVNRTRATALGLLNLELDLVRPWVSGGNYDGMIDSTDPEVVGAVLATDRARLVIPLWVGDGAQCVPGQAATQIVSFVVPGVPETFSAYLLAPGGLQPLKRERVTRGVKVTVENFALSSLILLTQDPLAISSLSRRVAAITPQAAELHRELAALKLRSVEITQGRLPNDPTAQQYIQQSRHYLQLCDQALSAGDFRTARMQAERASRPLRLVEREGWNKAIASVGSPIVTPASASYSTLPWHWAWVNEVRSATAGPNLLAGGDFEDLPAMQAAGWNHFQCGDNSVHARTQLSETARHGGRFGCRLSAVPSQPEDAPAVIETPPVWITSPSIPVPVGGMVRIRGWVRVPAEITGSVDGLMLVDSLTGESLAARFHRTDDWQPFTLYRKSATGGVMNVSFVLTGIGEAWIDDVSIDLLSPR